MKYYKNLKIFGIPGIIIGGYFAFQVDIKRCLML